MKTEDKIRKRSGDGSPSLVSQHALLWESHAHSTVSSPAPSSRPRLDYRSLGSLSGKINASRLIFDQTSSNNNNVTPTSTIPITSSTTSSSSSSSSSTTATSSTSSSAPNVKKIHRGRTDFGQLLQKFSGSEGSGSEKSDNESCTLSRSQSHHLPGATPPRLNVLRSSVERNSTSGEAGSSPRRTPERSQSLKVGARSSVEEEKIKNVSEKDSMKSKDEMSKGVEGVSVSGSEKNSSYKSDFMTRKMSGQTSLKKDEDGSSDGGRVSNWRSPSLSAAASGTGSGSGSGSESESGGRQSRYRRLRNQIVSDLNGGSTTAASGETNSTGKNVTSSADVRSSSATGSGVLEPLSVTTQQRSVESGVSSISPSSHLESKTSHVFENQKTQPTSSLSQREFPGNDAGKQSVENVETSRCSNEDTPSSGAEPPSIKDLTTESASGQSTSSATLVLSPSASSSSTSSSLSSSVLPSSSSTMTSEKKSNDVTKKSPSEFTSNLSLSTSTPCIASSSSSESASFSAATASTTEAISSTESSSNTSTTTPTNIRRAYSFKDVSAEHSANSEARRGILKRATSLTKKDLISSPSSAPFLDPQLAKILQQRRQIQGDVKEEDEEEEEEDEDVTSNVVKRRSRALSAAEEIEENLKYSKEKAAERGIDPENDETFKRRSVADRIFFMQAKIEEVKQGSSSGSRSGVSTPRSRPRSGPITPTQQRSLDEAIYGSTLSPRSPPPPKTLSSSTSPVIARSPCSPSRTFKTTIPPSSSSSSLLSSSKPTHLSGEAKDKDEDTQTPAVSNELDDLSDSSNHKVKSNSSTIEDNNQSLRSKLNFDDDKDDDDNDKDKTVRSSFSSTNQKAPVTHGNEKNVLEKTSIPSLDLSGITGDKCSDVPTRKDGGGGGGGVKTGSSGKAVSGDQLMQKLSEIADANEAYEERRQRFQQRPKDDWRHRTQPVTLEEIHAADRLETVASFRALIRKETSTGIFKQFQQQQQQQQDPTGLPQQQKTIKGKGEEFPQHLAPPNKHQRRPRNSRYNTLPVTAEELKAVPENTELGTDSCWDQYIQALRAVEATASSDVDLSAEYDNSLRTLTLEMEVDERDPAAMSVSAKTGIFKAIDDKKNKSASGAKRYINRKKRERSQTMPITDDEVKSAAEEQQQQTVPSSTAFSNGLSRCHLVKQRQPEVVNRSKSVDDSRYDDNDDDNGDDDPENDQLTKLSLSEKVKLFSQPKEAEKVLPRPEVPVVRRRHRKQASRFNTQPVTTEEVEKAAASTRISPLAMSMVKPPDPDILKGLPLKDQRQLMAAHAEMCLSQSSSRSHSRSGSMANLESSQNSSRRGSSDTTGSTLTLTDKDGSSPGTKSILKSDAGTKDQTQEIHGILKSGDPTTSSPSSTTTTSSNPYSKSILKIKSDEARSESSAASDEDDQHKSILKTTLSSSSGSEDNNDRDLWGQQHHRSRSNSQPSGILKHDEKVASDSAVSSTSISSTNLNSSNSSSSKPTRGILKTTSQEKIEEGGGGIAVKSALRRGSSDVDDSASSSNVTSSTLKSALKQNSSHEDGGEFSHNADSPRSDGVKESSGRMTEMERDDCSKDEIIKVSGFCGGGLWGGDSMTDKMAEVSISEGLTNENKDGVVIVDALSSQLCCVDMDKAKVEDGSGHDGMDKDLAGSVSEKQDPEMEESGSSSGEVLEDTPRSRIKKKRFADRMARSQRYKSQPADLTPTTISSESSTLSTPSQDATKAPETGEVKNVKKKYKYEGRHRTQPITDDEMRDAEANAPVKNNLEGSLTPGGSIADRLNQLRTSGNEEWKKRVDKKDELITPADLVKKREKKVENDRPKSIVDRLNEIEVSKMSWKGRVEESDAKMFTVAGKIGTSPGTPPASPLLSRRAPKTAGTTITDSPACPSTPVSKPSVPSSATSTPFKESISKIPLPKVIIKDAKTDADSVSSPVTTSVKKSDSFKTKVKVVDDDARPSQEVKVEVPKVDEDLEDFFHTKSMEEISKERVEMGIEDFDDISVDPGKILTNVRKARPTRKTKSSSRNPLKAMAQTIEVKQEYTQQSQGVADREFKRVKKENLAKDAGLAAEALAGLASNECFKSVELRRSDSNSLAHGQRLDPFNDVMLLQVKGRRSVQTRLVEPHTRSLNAGDCYILVTPDKLVQWEGQFANVIEKAKASEIAQIIQAKKDLGCKKASDVLMVTQARDEFGPGKILWSTLEGERQCQDCGPETEDEVYESSMTRSNMVYRLEGDALIPYEEYWGVTLKHQMLKRNEVLVFDFGTEFYVWQGKGVSLDQRKLSLRLAKQLYEKGFDYSQAPINPVSPLRSPENGGLPLKADKRPKWAIFGKVNQNMETVLFREKFSDWPDSSRLIQLKGHDSDTPNKELQTLKAYDAKKMLPISRLPVTLKLEGADVGRGVKWSEDMQGFIKEQDIITLEVNAWHVLEYEHFKLPVTSQGQFHDGDTYVVRWQYMIANANLRSLKKGSTSSHNSLTGRERCAYFFWQGNQSTINEKGASALMTVELDEERGPQVRVLEGKEPPCFLNLFGGKMILHIGKREEPETNTQGPWRLYCLRGDYDNEMYLLEVPVCLDHLRSRSSMVLLNVDTGRTYIWHGVRAPSHVRKLCKKAVDNIQDNIPLELGMREGVRMEVKEVEEGEEGEEIWMALGKKNRDKYHSLIMNPVPTCTKTLRLFHMSSVNMIFEVHEQLSPCRTTEFTSAFPFLQLDLYTAIQPALFLVDCHHSVFLWQGWWPTASKDHQNVHTGSATARFNMDRRLAMETTLSYCREKSPSDPPKAHIVCAGVEPLAFTTLFPYWIVNDAIRDLAIEDGKSLGYMEDVTEVLHRVTQTRYTLSELQERPLPEGVDPLKLETFLHDKDFEECLEMTRDEFYTQPAWKQRHLKQMVGLF